MLDHIYGCHKIRLTEHIAFSFNDKKEFHANKSCMAHTHAQIEWYGS